MAAPVTMGALASEVSYIAAEMSCTFFESVSRGESSLAENAGNGVRIRPSVGQKGELKKIECCKTERKRRGGDVTGG